MTDKLIDVTETRALGFLQGEMACISIELIAVAETYADDPETLARRMREIAERVEKARATAKAMGETRVYV